MDLKITDHNRGNKGHTIILHWTHVCQTVTVYSAVLNVGPTHNTGNNLTVYLLWFLQYAAVISLKSVKRSIFVIALQCEIRGSHSGDFENYCLPWYAAVYFGRYVPTCLHPSLESEEPEVIVLFFCRDHSWGDSLVTPAVNNLPLQLCCYPTGSLHTRFHSDAESACEVSPSVESRIWA